MSYILTNTNCDQVSFLKNTLKTWSEERKDLVLLTEDGGKIFTNSRVLSLHSPMFRIIYKDLSLDQIIHVSVPVSFRCMENLMLLINTGIAQTIDIDPVIAAANVLDIKIGNVEVGLVESEMAQNSVGYEIEKAISMNIVLPAAPVLTYPLNGDLFSCDVCTMKFTQINELINHSKMHMELATNVSLGDIQVKTEVFEAPLLMFPLQGDLFSCDVCPMKFRQIIELNNHSKMHIELTSNASLGETKVKTEVFEHRQFDALNARTVIHQQKD
jgi:hypothetical protein